MHPWEGAVLWGKGGLLCRELCKNGWTDRDDVWNADSRGPKEPRIREGYRSAMLRGGVISSEKITPTCPRTLPGGDNVPSWESALFHFTQKKLCLLTSLRSNRRRFCLRRHPRTFGFVRLRSRTSGWIWISGRLRGDRRRLRRPRSRRPPVFRRTSGSVDHRRLRSRVRCFGCRPRGRSRESHGCFRFRCRTGSGRLRCVRRRAAGRRSGRGGDGWRSRYLSRRHTHRRTTVK